MLNQKTVIYSILSAILLYLYYLRRDLTLFAAFAVVVAGTLIIGKDFNSIEGLNHGGDSDIGCDNDSGSASGSASASASRSASRSTSGSTSASASASASASGNECADMGFTDPKIEKDANGDMGESLEKEIKKIKEIADKYWPYNMKGESSNEDDKKILMEYFGVYAKLAQEIKFSDDDNKTLTIFIDSCKIWYEQVNNSDQSKRQQIRMKASDFPKDTFKVYISVANKFYDILNKTTTSSELKTTGAKKLAKYLSCLCKHWIMIFIGLDNMTK